MGSEALLVEALDELPGSGCNGSPGAIAIAEGKPASRKGKIEKRGTARGEGEPSVGTDGCVGEEFSCGGVVADVSANGSDWCCCG